jgi:hypothetical protein
MMVLKFAILLCISMLATALYAAKTDERINWENQYYLLKSYKLMYTEEIFDYCIEKKGTIVFAAGGCMIRQNKIKNEILDYAHDQLGRRSLAQSIYDDCADYHPKNGAKRISECVKTRLMFDRKLEDDIIKEKIYQKCDFKWRKHGSSAINNCSIMEANYYREKGQLRD